MSFATAFVIIFVLFPIAALLLLLILCMTVEYLLYRSAQVQLKAMEQFWGNDEEPTEIDEPTSNPDILDYSKTPSTGI